MGQSQDVGMGGSDCDCDTHSVFLTNKINEKQSPRNGLLVLKVLFSSSFSVSLLEYLFGAHANSHYWSPYTYFTVQLGEFVIMQMQLGETVTEQVRMQLNKQKILSKE